MKDIHELIKEKNSLPLGNLYKKTINGKEYIYHQFSINGVKHSSIVKKENVNAIQKLIERRIQLETQIKALIQLGNKNLSLSKNARSLTGFVMKGNSKVAEFSNGELVFIDEEKCPYIIKRTRRLEPFLKTRVIDLGRANSRLIKKVLSIKENDDCLISLSSYTLSISDNYWFKPLHSKLTYDDIAFNNDLFFNLSLKGIVSYYPNKLVLTPELTTVGSYEKGWKLEKDEWWLYKVGSKEEIFSELFYSHLFELLHLPTAHYEHDNGYIKSKNFSSGYCFEPIIGLVGDDDSYDHVFNILYNLDRRLSLSYLLLCFFDVVLNNIDRHNENCGVLRHLNSGKLISFAPNYDNNLSLVSRDKDILNNPNEGFYKQFISLLRKNKLIKESFKQIEIPKIDRTILAKCYEDINFCIEIDKEKLFDFIIFRYDGLIKEINK